MKLFRRKSAGTSSAQAPDGAAQAKRGDAPVGLQLTPEASAAEMLSFRRTLAGGDWAPSVPVMPSDSAPAAAATEPAAAPAPAPDIAAAEDDAGLAPPADNVAPLSLERPAVAPEPAAAVVDKYVTSRPRGARAPSQPPQSPFSNSSRRQPPRSSRTADAAEAEAGATTARAPTSRPRPSQPRSYQSRGSQPLPPQGAAAPSPAPEPASPPPSAPPSQASSQASSPAPAAAPAEPLPDLSLVEMPGATAGRTARRAGRVKTRLMGFEHSGEASDPFAAAGAEAGSTAAPDGRRCPVGWIVVVAGPGRGACFTLFNGVSPIGRGSDQAVRLDFGDTAISRNSHAVVAYDPEQRKYFLGHGGKANIVRLNDMPVLSTEEISDGDEIRIGETTLRFVAFCKDGFDWRDGEEEEVDDVDGL
ncbi:FHA domain-containing protein [Acidimangrovimonas pyrenivorans]|uniref:FHA domain-containing protein n=1 Tax=Acidimangrovimonas pyrenivorans TaxID=2030798 RepID=A0ABV7AF73_9RHOB